MSEADKAGPKFLFVCTANQDRSPTAESIFRAAGYEARSCGSHPMANVPANRDLLEWADVIVCMEGHHANALLDAFPDAIGEKKIFVLGIADAYPRNDPRLVTIIRDRMAGLGFEA